MPKKHAKNQTEQPSDEVLDFNKPDYEFIPGEHHDWRQQGPYLVCKSCELQHGTHIGMKKILVGFSKDGKPILKTRKLNTG